jgi:hypothetical protein
MSWRFYSLKLHTILNGALGILNVLLLPLSINCRLAWSLVEPPAASWLVDLIFDNIKLMTTMF